MQQTAWPPYAAGQFLIFSASLYVFDNILIETTTCLLKYATCNIYTLLWYKLISYVDCTNIHHFNLLPVLYFFNKFYNINCWTWIWYIHWQNFQKRLIKRNDDVIAGVLVGLCQVPLVLVMCDTLGGSSCYATVVSQWVVTERLQEKFPYLARSRGGMGNWWQVC